MKSKLTVFLIVVGLLLVGDARIEISLG
ncbi:uncharacterized protein METZ01_LOCUS321262 [marine metagenome]|uniref:Uncharacterized protein n=1 Tax=marine metagenome TaxID=408172 RepID=A0A382P6P4_9ZZZZ